jgi:formylglycine-generating enzyme
MHSFNRFLCRFARALLLVALILISFERAYAVVISTVPIGNAGNAGDATPVDGVRGAVAYNYRIGTTEVTNAQYAEFLNAKATSDPLQLYSPQMGSASRGGISRDGVDGSYSYSVRANMGNKPVNFVNVYDAMRFTNWLQNGQGSGDTESGGYTLNGGTPFPSNPEVTRNSGATWFLPSEDEWYKAAYYQPAAQGGDSDSYWLYSTRSNTAPMIAIAESDGDVSNPGSNIANYLLGADWNLLNGNLTTVGGIGPLSASYYGTDDQGGNVTEWTESFLNPSFWILRGGSYTASGGISANERNLTGALAEFDRFGFRVAAVPEPSTYVMAAMGFVAILAVGRRKLSA